MIAAKLIFRSRLLPNPIGRVKPRIPPEKQVNLPLRFYCNFDPAFFIIFRVRSRFFAADHFFGGATYVFFRQLISICGAVD
jgi:hypothetical protein